MARPRPVPPYFRVVEVSACSKGRNRRSSCSGARPMPVSVTSKRTCRRLLSRESRRALNMTLPRSVNLMALLPRLINICPRRSGSPDKRRLASSSGMSMCSCKPLSAAAWLSKPDTLPKTALRSIGICSSSRCSASIFEISRISLMTPSKCLEAPITLFSWSACLASTVRRRARSVIPMMAFIGVRNSWLILARNALFARLAASAASLAICSATVRSATSSSRWSR
ncbi:hypothetical protein SDC9_149311 [bioreactor metagenome]|uniref:Uncharacterized protein n=1 Tax=bioreactor metagenome TaxID=1076179 RepID=A0A645EJA4_9ZZZZ